MASSKPTDVRLSPNSFDRYYDFHFASIDCVAFGDLCSAHDVAAYPTFSLYKDAQLVKKFDGHKDMEGLSHFVEETLESIRPGSRPKGGIKLPEPGARSVDTEAGPDNPVEKDKDPARGKAAGARLKEALATKSASASAKNSKETVKPKSAAPPPTSKSKKPTSTPNLGGASVSLSQESFQKLVTNTQDPWFVKFYAPWCHHCQAMAPSWAQMAKELQGKLNIGEVNCDVEVRLCKDVHVKAYPNHSLLPRWRASGV